jgi:nucleoside-diphosphate-sugar epimerase
MIVVTGGSGFLGGAIARALLNRGERVRVVQRRDAPALRSAGAEVVQADLGDRDAPVNALRGVRAVMHVAASTRMWGDEAATRRANVDATRNVIEACHAHGIRTLVYTSTPSVVHPGGDVEGVDESVAVATHFLSPYPATKAEAETMVLAANSPALATCALRPHLIWGPNDPQVTARVIDRARKGRLRLVGGGEKLIDGTYIDNAVAAHLAALDRLEPGAPCAGRAYFVTQGEPMPQHQLINGILDAAGLPPCTRSVSPGAARMVGAICEAIWFVTRRNEDPPMTRFIAAQLATAHWYDITAARRDLGYNPTITTVEGLRRLKESLK